MTKTDYTKDDVVAAEINRLKKGRPVEYEALKELCDDKGMYSLGGLPLALLQAGSVHLKHICVCLRTLTKRRIRENS